MIEHLHSHITSELQQNQRSDTIFIIAAIVLNLLILAVNSGFSYETDPSFLVAMMLFVGLAVLVNVSAIFGLLKGQQTKTKLLKGLQQMYQDQGIAKYYDESLLSNYQMRYLLFILVIVFTGFIAVAIPFIIR